MSDDPEFGDPPRHECDKGWRFVTASYAEHMTAGVTDPAERAERVAGLLWSVYPCKVCRPAQFFRWVQGHYLHGHDPTECDACKEAHRPKRRVRAGQHHEEPGRPPERPPERADVDG